MKLVEEDRGAHSVLSISGTLALGDATRALQERFEKLAKDRSGAVILDLSGLEHLDSTAIGVFVGGLKKFDALGRRFYIVNPRERVAAVFRITHLDQVFRVFPTLDAALAVANLPGKEEETGGR
jgi:anti-sigma B factor antagonist